MDFSQIIVKSSILVKIFEKLRFSSNFEKFRFWSKYFEKFLFCSKIFENISIFWLNFEKFRFW